MLLQPLQEGPGIAQHLVHSAGHAGHRHVLCARYLPLQRPFIRLCNSAGLRGKTVVTQNKYTTSKYLMCPSVLLLWIASVLGWTMTSLPHPLGAAHRVEGVQRRLLERPVGVGQQQLGD